MDTGQVFDEFRTDDELTPVEQAQAAALAAVQNRVMEIYRWYTHQLRTLRQLTGADLRDGELTRYRADGTLVLDNVTIMPWISAQAAEPSETGTPTSLITLGLVAKADGGRNVHPLRVIFERLDELLRGDPAQAMPVTPELDSARGVVTFTVHVIL